MTKFIEEFKNKEVISQLILNPKKINLSKIDIERFESKKDLFNRLGFDVEMISENSLLIREIPMIFELPEDDKFFYDILDLENNFNDDLLINKLKKLVNNMSFKKGHVINKDEAILLYSKLLSEDNPYKTYDGKDTIISIKDKELEKYFEK